MSPEIKNKRTDHYRKTANNIKVNCINCNIIFQRKSANQSYCSISCRKEQQDIASYYKRATRAIFDRKKENNIINWLGCSPLFLKTYIESKFQPGMTWENYKKLWVIDHIIPFSKTNLKNNSELLNIVNYKNLQPLWNSENCRKQNRL
jgi:hypothetical protein